jgi:hypothetical protein
VRGKCYGSTASSNLAGQGSIPWPLANLDKKGLSMSNIINISSSFIRGHKAAIQGVKDKDIYNIPVALELFMLDPPNTDYQRGYLSGLRACLPVVKASCCLESIRN